MFDVLIHYTTNENVYKKFNNDYLEIKEDGYIERYEQVDLYYKNCNISQDNLFMIIQYYSSTGYMYIVGKIIKESSDTYMFVKVEEEIQKYIVDEFQFEKSDTYTKDYYYKIFSCEDDFDFKLSSVDRIAKKIKLKYFSWDELFFNNAILHEKLVSMLFDKSNVVKLTSLYNAPIKNISDRIYYACLQNIGFISETGINTKNTVLQGDIGEFLMNAMIENLIFKGNKSAYVFPKLAFKTTPNVSIHGNDGTFYNPEKKKIYYLEAKFYTDLKQALDKAIESINMHKYTDEDFLLANCNVFRNIVTEKTGDIIDIGEDVKENVIIFLMCADVYNKKDIEKIITDNNKLKELDDIDEFIVLVLPILNKEDFLKMFEKESKEINQRKVKK